MAKNISLRLGGGMFDLAVSVKPAVQDGDDDTKLRTVCVGDGMVADQATGELLAAEPHAPVPPKQRVTCPSCGISHSSFNNGWHKAHDNGDGTFTEVPAEVAGAKPGEEYTKTPSLTLHPITDIEQRTLPSGKVYYLEPGKDAAAKYPAMVGAVKANEAQGRAWVTMYAPVSVISLYRLIVIGEVLAMQELAMPEKVRPRPALGFPDPQQAHVDMLVTAGGFAFGPLDPDTYQDEQRKLIAAALASATPAAQDEQRKLIAAALASATAGAGATPVVAAPRVDPFDLLAARLASGEKVPLQPLPATVPDNVAVLPEAAPKAAPRKRAPRKKVAEKVSA